MGNVAVSRSFTAVVLNRVMPLRGASESFQGVQQALHALQHRKS